MRSDTPHIMSHEHVFASRPHFLGRTIIFPRLTHVLASESLPHPTKAYRPDQVYRRADDQHAERRCGFGGLVYKESYGLGMMEKNMSNGQMVLVSKCACDLCCLFAGPRRAK